MAYFKPRRDSKGITKNRRLPKVPEGLPVAPSLYDAFLESIWRGNLDEYYRRKIGYNLAGENIIPYPDQGTWWSDPRSRLNLLHEFNKYFPEETLEKERIIKKSLDEMEKSFYELELKPNAKKRPKTWGREEERAYYEGDILET